MPNFATFAVGAVPPPPPPGGFLWQKVFFIGRQLIRRVPQAAAFVLAGNAVYYLAKPQPQIDVPADIGSFGGGFSGGGGSVGAEDGEGETAAYVPPMWARDP